MNFWNFRFVNFAICSPGMLCTKHSMTSKRLMLFRVDKAGTVGRELSFRRFLRIVAALQVARHWITVCKGQPNERLVAPGVHNSVWILAVHTHKLCHTASICIKYKMLNNLGKKICNLFLTSTYLQTKFMFGIFFYIFTDKNESK